MDDQPKPRVCENCQKPARPCEVVAYGRCEDCWVGKSPDTGGARANRFSGLTSSGRHVTKNKAPY